MNLLLARSATVRARDYPTLVELCGLRRPEHLEGLSLVPLLESPARGWERPALTTLRPGSHSVRSERWRLIRYEDGTEELYDHESDPHEWQNLADDPRFVAVKRDLARWMPAPSDAHVS